MTDHLIHEIRRAARRLFQAPGFTLFSIATLALGIGVTTAAYSVLYSGFWRPPGVAAPDELVFLRLTNSESARRQARISAAEFADLDRAQTSFEPLIATAQVGTVVSAAGGAELTGGEAVTGPYFSQLGVTPLRGRVLQAADDDPGSPFVVVLSEQTWRRRFASSENVVGATIKIGGGTATVVGVAPGGFRGLRTPAYAVLGFWIPMSRIGDVNPAYRRPGRTVRDHFVVGRLRSGVSIERAAEDASRIGQQLDIVSPLPPLTSANAAEPPSPMPRFWSVGPLLGDPLGEGEIAKVILALPGLVLVVACMNLANLILSRGISRRHELAVRAALGASRWRLVREQALEGAMIAVAGAAIGLLLAKGIISAGVVLVQSALANSIYNSNVIDWQLDRGALTGAVMAGLIALFIAGVLPAIRLTRTHVRSALDLENATTSMPNWKSRGNLIALQVGASVGLFLIAAIFVRMVFRDLPMFQRPAADLSGVAVASVPLSLQPREEGRAREIVQRILERLRARPEIDIAAVATASPIVPFSYAGRGSARATTIDGVFKSEYTHRTGGDIAMVTPGYLALAGIRLAGGRDFNDNDTAGSPRVVVINEGLALDLFGTTDAVGRPMLMKIRDPYRSDPPTVTATIVGIVEGRKKTPTGGYDGQLFVPFAQEFDRDLLIFARARDRRDAPVGVVLAEIRRADPDLAAQFAVDADQLASGSRAGLQLAGGALAGLAAIALVLSMTGLYGVLSHVVFRRTRELGVRIALGADRRRIAALVLKDGFRPVLEGLFIGLGAAIGIRMAMRGQFTAPIAAIDPVAFGLAVVLLLAAASIACFIPARRATRVDPNVALREL
jgi:putative ABC transport system permease protein